MSKTIFEERLRYPKKEDRPTIDQAISLIHAYFEKYPSPTPDPELWFTGSALLCESMFLKARLHWRKKQTNPYARKLLEEIIEVIGIKLLSPAGIAIPSDGFMTPDECDAYDPSNPLDWLGLAREYEAESAGEKTQRIYNNLRGDLQYIRQRDWSGEKCISRSFSFRCSIDALHKRCLQAFLSRSVGS